MTDFYEIVDTAVKIGLGALISGGAAFFLARNNNTAEKEKLLLTRKLENLEKAAGDFNEYTHAFSRFLAAIDGVRLGLKSDEPLDLSLPANKGRFDFIHAQDILLCDTRDKLAHVYAKLRLHQVVGAAELVDKLPRFEARIRHQVMFDRALPTRADITSARDEITTIRSQFYDSLQNGYKV